MEWAAGAQLLGRAHVMRILLIIYLDIIVIVKSNPDECDVPNILRKEEELCLEMLANDQVGSGLQAVQADCVGEWDNLTCWPSASLGNTVALPCPKVIYMVTHKQGFIYRNCTNEGWSEMFPGYKTACGYDTKYFTDLVKVPFYMNVMIIYTVGHSTSFISLSIAVAILGSFRKLRCTRNYIHMHLFVSYILRAISIFIKDSVLFSSEDSQHCDSQSVECKVVIVFFQYCNMANFSWLLVEASYLHTALVVTVFSEHKYFWRYIVLGWGAPAVFTTLWSIARQIYENIGCWDVNSDQQIWWIIKGPLTGSIFINFFLFLRIMRILIKNLKTPDAMRNDLNQYRRLAKSTLLLIPLFGIHYIVFVIIPEKESNLSMDLRLGFEIALGSFQGLVVAILYCFLNGEVRVEIKRKWRRRKGNQHNSIISNGWMVEHRYIY
ncbi:secretin receptor-like isoform X1 [Scyliorhinus torazame]|uniref:Secretin receptor n=1 Tax=Scyliorhinus torazame TaxID=75743 RepID=A0A401NKQ9_SCYTO|nr:hypothetical protein [Scyliorhinus torazame]